MDLRLTSVASLLDNAVKNDERVVVYHSIAMFSVQTYIVEAGKSNEVAKYLANSKGMVIDDIASLYGEIGIIDKTLLKSIIRKVMDYMLPLEESKDDTFYHDSLTSSCFEDVLRVTKFFSKETIDLINSNFELYKRATIEMARVKELLKSVIYKD